MAVNGTKERLTKEAVRRELAAEAARAQIAKAQEAKEALVTQARANASMCYFRSAGAKEEG